MQRVKAETKTAGGIFLPESSVKELNEAKVLAVGPGAMDKDGKRIAMSVAAGDRVLIPQVRSFFWGACLVLLWLWEDGRRQGGLGREEQRGEGRLLIDRS